MTVLELPRVLVTRPMVGICGMQVCAAKGATDEEILTVCNKENPAGTAGGWSIVVRKANADKYGDGEKSWPAQCDDHYDREHFMVVC